MSGESLWSSPLVLAILAAAVGLIGNVGVTWLNSSEQRKLEQERALFNDKLESSKSEAARILEVIKTDPEKAANNLKFLIETGLVSDRNIQKSVTEYLAKNPGKGPSLPSSLPTGPIEIDPQFNSRQSTGLPRNSVSRVYRQNLRMTLIKPFMMEPTSSG